MAALSKRKQVLLWIVAASVATAGLILVIGLEYGSGSARHAVYVIGDPAKGATLFFGSKHCSTCHSVNGTGGRLAPDLAGIQPGKPAMGWLTTVLWNHAPGMWRQMRRSYSPSLSEEDMAHILAFLYQVGLPIRPATRKPASECLQRKGMRALPLRRFGRKPGTRPEKGWPHRAIWWPGCTRRGTMRRRCGPITTESTHVAGVHRPADERPDLLTSRPGAPPHQPTAYRGQSPNTAQVFQVNASEARHSASKRAAKLVPENSGRTRICRSTRRSSP